VCVSLKSLKNKPRRHSQAGAVLIMVLLIVALVAGLSIKFAGDYEFGLARAEARWYGAQARAYLFSGEGAAIKFLATDDPASDYLDELWAQPVPITLPDGAGQVLLQMVDANSKFNLNSLVGTLDPAKGALEANRYTIPQRMFMRLLQSLPNPNEPGTPLLNSPDQAAAIVEAIVDWTDPDSNPSGANGAENDYYLSQPDPYQAANMPFRSVDELQLVRGVTPDLMRVLRPYITVLEPNERLNINTMAPIFYRTVNLSSELTPLSESQAETLRKEVPSAGHYVNMSDFDTAWTKAVGTAGAIDKDLTVKTNFFWLTTVVQIGDQRRVGCSLLQRGNPLFQVVRREEDASKCMASSPVVISK